VEDAERVKVVLRGLRKSFNRRKAARSAELQDELEEKVHQIKLDEISNFLKDPAVLKK